MVLDLQIEKGLVKPLVAGSEKKRYEITIKIDLLNKNSEKIIDAVGNKIESVEQLENYFLPYLKCLKNTST